MQILLFIAWVLFLVFTLLFNVKIEFKYKAKKLPKIEKTYQYAQPEGFEEGKNTFIFWLKYEDLDSNKIEKETMIKILCEVAPSSS